MRKCPILWKIAAMIIVITALFSLAYTLSNDEKAHITVVEYEDVTGSEWYCEAVETLVHGKIIDGKGKFDGASNVNGYQALEYLYSLSNSLGIKIKL